MKFELGAVIVTLDTPAQYPLASNTMLMQAKERSANGIPHVESFEVRSTIRTFTFVNMSTPDFTKLLGFFLDNADGMLNQFLLTDDLGGITTVRFNEPNLNFQLTYLDLWDGSFSVEEVG